jgi:hypothetical protein
VGRRARRGVLLLLDEAMLVQVVLLLDVVVGGGVGRWRGRMRVLGLGLSLECGGGDGVGVGVEVQVGSSGGVIGCQWWCLLLSLRLLCLLWCSAQSTSGRLGRRLLRLTGTLR